MTKLPFCYTFCAYDWAMEQFRDKVPDQVAHICNADRSPHQCLQDCLSFRLILLRSLAFLCLYETKNYPLERLLHKTVIKPVTYSDFPTTAIKCFSISSLVLLSMSMSISSPFATQTERVMLVISKAGTVKIIGSSHLPK